MRPFVFTIALAFVFAALPAHGEDLASAPGWSLTKAADPAQEDNVYADSRVFYSLKPPDARPAITVDSNTADRLRSGDASAEGTYSGQSATGKKKEEDEFVYGNHGNGIVMADPINSTLTADEGRKDLPSPVAQNSSGQSGPRGSGISGFGSGGLSSDSGHITAQKALSMVNGSGASRMPSAAAAASAGSSGGTAAAAGGGPFQDPRAIAAASGHAAPQGKSFAGGVAVNNVALGFGEKVGTSSSTDTNFIIWPNGDPATMTKTNTDSSTCASSGTSLTFSTPTLQRISIPSSCHNIRVRAWGAGGGAGSATPATTSDLGIVAGDGGGGAYIDTRGPVDGVQYDLVIVAGSAGGDAKPGVAGLPGFVSGGMGGVSSDGSAGGGGGGYSGVFLVDKTIYPNGETPQVAQLAIAVAGGGGGASGQGGAGGGGGLSAGGGTLGATVSSGGSGIGNGHAGVMYLGGAAGTGGGGGGGGMYGGGGSAVNSDGVVIGGGGGSSFFRFKTSTSVGMDASGATAANSGDSKRGEAGNAGKNGLVLVDFY